MSEQVRTNLALNKAQPFVWKNAETSVPRLGMQGSNCDFSMPGLIVGAVMRV